MPGAVPPAMTVSIALRKLRRLAMITLSLVPRCSRVRSAIAPIAWRMIGAERPAVCSGSRR